MAKKVIITVAPTSNFQGKEANPNLPIQPDEVAQAVYDCYNAGAAVVPGIKTGFKPMMSTCSKK